MGLFTPEPGLPERYSHHNTTPRRRAGANAGCRGSCQSLRAGSLHPRELRLEGRFEPV